MYNHNKAQQSKTVCKFLGIYCTSYIIGVIRLEWLFRYKLLHLSWWRHQMKTFSALLALCAGNSPVTGEFPAQRPVTRSFDVFFDLLLNKRLSKIRVAGDLRRHRGHYDVTVIVQIQIANIYLIMWDKPGQNEKHGLSSPNGSHDIVVKQTWQNVS